MLLYKEISYISYPEGFLLSLFMNWTNWIFMCYVLILKCVFDIVVHGTFKNNFSLENISK
jgi:hypothetical protein